MSRQQRRQQQLLSVQGTIEVVQQSDVAIILDIQPNERVVVLKNDDISSISSKDTKKICNELKKIIGCTVKMSFKDNNEQKIEILDKVKIVKKNGKDVLRVTASSDEFNTFGRFARDVTDLDETSKTFEATLDFISSQDPAAAACAENQMLINTILDDQQSTDAQKVKAFADFAIKGYNLSCGPPPFQRS